MELLGTPSFTLALDGCYFARLHQFANVSVTVSITYSRQGDNDERIRTIARICSRPLASRVLISLFRRDRRFRGDLLEALLLV